jgi:hypothetical protein
MKKQLSASLYCSSVRSNALFICSHIEEDLSQSRTSYLWWSQKLTHPGHFTIANRSTVDEAEEVQQRCNRKDLTSNRRMIAAVLRLSSM